MNNAGEHTYITNTTLCCHWCGIPLGNATNITCLNGNLPICDLCLMKHRPDCGGTGHVEDVSWKTMYLDQKDITKDWKRHKDKRIAELEEECRAKADRAKEASQGGGEMTPREVLVKLIYDYLNDKDESNTDAHIDQALSDLSEIVMGVCKEESSKWNIEDESIIIENNPDKKFAVGVRAGIESIEFRLSGLFTDKVVSD